MIKDLWKNWVQSNGPELEYDHRQRLFLGNSGFIIRQRPGSRKAAKGLSIFMLLMTGISLFVVIRLAMVGASSHNILPGLLVALVFLTLAFSLAILILSEYTFNTESGEIIFKLGPLSFKKSNLGALKKVHRTDLNWEKDQQHSGLLAGALKKSNGVHGCAYHLVFENGKKFRIGTLQVRREVELMDSVAETLNIPVNHKSIS